MADRPIIFSDLMVCALLDGRKTQTRRVLGKHSSPRKPNIFDGTWSDDYVLDPGNESWRARCIPYAPGDRLYVRESVRGEELPDGLDGVRFRADDAFRPIGDMINGAARWLALHTYRDHSGHPIGPWVPSIHMPRWASRLTLTVTEVRVQRLQDIREDDAAAEGVHATRVMSEGFHLSSPSFVASFQGLWNRLHGRGAWDANPWVVALTFTVQRSNIDEPGGAS